MFSSPFAVIVAVGGGSFVIHWRHRQLELKAAWQYYSNVKYIHMYAHLIFLFTHPRTSCLCHKVMMGADVQLI